jgi:putative ABC transport system permease protein
MGWLPLWLRQLWHERLAGFGLLLFVLVTSLIMGLIPRAIDRLSDDALERTITSAPRPEWGIVLLADERLLHAGPEPLAAIESGRDEREAQMPEGIRDLIASRSSAADTPRWSILSPTRAPATFRLHVDEGAESRIQYVEGRAPEPTVTTETLPVPGRGDLPLEVREVGLSTQALEELGVAVGDTLVGELDQRDFLGIGTEPPPRAIRVTGAFEPIDPDDPYWMGDQALWVPFLRALSDNLQISDALAMVPSETYPSLLTSSIDNPWKLRYTYRFTPDISRLHVDDLGSTAADLRRLEGTYHYEQGRLGVAPSGTLMRTSLLRLVEGFEDRWVAARGLIAVLAVGPAAVALIALAFVVTLVLRRRRPLLAVSRSRGSSLLQVGVGTLVESLAVILLPLALALVLAAWILPTQGDAAVAATAAVLVAAAAAVLLLVGTLRLAASRKAAADRDDAAGPPEDSTRRAVLEGLVIMLAIVGVLLVRERGGGGMGVVDAQGNVDLLLAATPVAVALAVALVSTRGVRRLLGGLASLVSRRRDLVPALAVRRSARDRQVAPILLVLVVATAVATVAAATYRQLDLAAQAAGFQIVGAPYQATLAGGFRTDADPAAIPGVEAIAAGASTVGTTDGNARPFAILAVDAEDYQALLVSAGLDPSIVDPLLEPAVVGDPIPTIVSETLATERNGPAETYKLNIGTIVADARIAAVRQAFPTLPAGGRFIVVPRGPMLPLDETGDLATNVWFLDAPSDPAAEAALRAGVDQVAPTTRVQSLDATVAAVESNPVAEGVFAAAAFSGLAVAAYAGVALVLALAMVGAARATEGGQLRALGMSRVQALGVAVLEHGPLAAVAFVIGVVVGLFSFLAVGAAQGLGDVTGTPLELPLGLEPLTLALVAGLFALTAGVGILLTAIMQYRSTPTEALRRGIR